MQLLVEAYEILSDSLKRHAYNASWEDAQNAEVDTESDIEVSAYLQAGNTPPYSYAFRNEHKALIKQYLLLLNTSLKQDAHRPFL